MKNVTITLGEDVAAWARVEAAKAGKSLSRYINDSLTADMQRSAEGERKKTAQWEALEKFLSGPGWPGLTEDLPSREELYAERLFHRHELLYAQDPKAPQKAKRVAEWLGALAETDAIVISPQVLNEYAHNIIRKFRHVETGRLLAELEFMQQWCRAQTSRHTAIHALRIHFRYQFSFYDACLIASALEYGCDLFLSEDLSHGQRISGMQIISPFRSEPGSIAEQN